MTDIDVHLEKISPQIDQSENEHKLELISLKENLAKTYNLLEEKIIDHFESLKTAIELRKTIVMQELKKTLNEKQSHMCSFLDNIEASEKENKDHVNKQNQILEIKRIKNFLNNERLEFISDKYFRYY